MKQQLEQRMNQLKAEFESGQRMLEEMEAKQMNLKTTLLRISGAMQVLEEMTAEDAPNEAAGLHAVESAAARKTV